jgi:hypothetical protein
MLVHHPKPSGTRAKPGYGGTASARKESILRMDIPVRKLKS